MTAAVATTRPLTLLGGPLDGQLADVTGWSAADRADGAALIADAPAGMYGAGG